jgi:cytochrome b6-f complex iron-sulfur subunit
MAGHPRSRRSFLRALTLSGLGLAGLLRYLTPTRPSATAGVTVRLEDVPAGGALVLPEQGVAVSRAATGQLEVLSLTCTHLGCRVTATEDGFACPCHGSTFDRHGQVMHGPAPAPLARLPFAQKDGLLRIEV